MQTSLETLDPKGNGHDVSKPIDMRIDPPVDDITSLHLREPTFQDVRIAEAQIVRDAYGRITDASSRDHQAVLLSRVCNVTRQQLDKMRISEVNRAYDFLMTFKDAGPAIGET
jgi:hypothetical protein